MLTIAGAVHHAGYVCMFRLHRNAGTSVPVTGARASHHHAVDGVVVLLHHLLLVLQQVVVTKSVKPREGQSQVGCLQKVLHLFAVRVKSRRVQLNVGRKHSVDDLRMIIDQL